MKKISLAGVILGVVLGALAALMSGTWVFWLGAGLAIGLLVGTAQGRRSQTRQDTYLRKEANS